MSKMKIKKNDLVQIIAGKDRGLQGKVIAVDVERQRVTVEGVNRMTRHVKAAPGAQGGGIVVSEAPIHVSNVVVCDPETKKPARIRMTTEEVERDGRKKTQRVRTFEARPGYAGGDKKGEAK